MLVRVSARICEYISERVSVCVAAHLLIERLHGLLQLCFVLAQLLALRLERLHVDTCGCAHVALDVVHCILGPLRLLVQSHQHCGSEVVRSVNK